MKTVQRANEIKRFDDETADRKVRNEGFNYVPKNTWKQIRDSEKQIMKDSAPIHKSNKKSNK